MLAWIDLEATGLAASADVLEVAAIVTDDQLREVGRFHRVVHSPIAEKLAYLGTVDPDGLGLGFGFEAAATGIDLVVVQLHARNGLWAESADSPHSVADVDDQLAEFLAQTATSTDAATAQVTRAQIAGSSIWFDRMLMAASLPHALRQLHYRCVDVTTLNELARRFCPGVLDGAPRKREVHRAVPDIEDSLALCRYYAGKAAPDAPPMLRTIVGDHIEEMLRKTGVDFLQFAKKKVTDRKARVAVFACALREALDDLSPDEQATWLKVVVAEVQR